MNRFTYSQTDLRYWCPCQSTSPHIPKIQTRPLHYSPFPQPCGLHPLPMYQLYNAPHQSVYSCLDALCRHKQNTREHLFGVAFVRKNRIIHFPRGKTLHLTIPSLSKQSGGQSAPTYTLGWYKVNLPYLQM